MANLSPAHFTCPCCGYPLLASKPYEKLPKDLKIGLLAPPYGRHWGAPSYEVCACCGFEFGNDDDPGTSVGVSFDGYRTEWLADGAKWFDNRRMPENWDVNEQLREAAEKGALG